MTITKHTDVTRGLTPLNHLTPLDHTGVTRGTGGLGPLEQAVKDAIDGNNGAYFTLYDYDTLNGDSSGSGAPITGDGQEVGYAADQSTNGNNLLQASAIIKPETATQKTEQGLVGVGGNDIIEAAMTGTSTNTVAIALRFTSPVTRTGHVEHMAAWHDDDASKYAILLRNASGSPTFAYGMNNGSTQWGSQITADGAFYVVGHFKGDTTSNSSFNGSADDILGDCGSSAPLDTISLINGGFGSFYSADHVISKAAFLMSPSAGDLAAMEAWVAVAGDA